MVSLLSQGLKNKEIATTLMISEGTVKVYLSRLFQKVGVKDRFELALFGLKNLTTGQLPVGEKGQRLGASAMPGLRSLVLDRPLEQPRVQQEPQRFGHAVASGGQPLLATREGIGSTRGGRRRRPLFRCQALLPNECYRQPYYR